MSANSVSFSPLAIARSRLVLVGASGAARNRVTELVCSLKDFDYVSADRLIEDESARNNPTGTSLRRAISARETVPPRAMLAAVRRWYWGRKPTRGFAMSDFPDSAGHAVVLDDWLDARDDTLTACVCFVHERNADGHSEAESVSSYYRDRGQLVCLDAAQSAEAAVQEFAERIGGLLADR